MKFDHFIVTRFALDIFNKPCSKEWIENRIPLFYKFYVSSLRAQINSNFRVLILVKNDIKLDLPKNFEVIKIEHWPKDLKLTIADRSFADWIITTRIDSDDAVADNFVDTIQKQFNEQTEPIVIDLETGMIIRDGDIGYIRYRSNMFLSMISRRESAVNCYAHNHTDMTKRFPTISLNSEEYWLINRHPNSISYNHREIGIRVTKDFVVLEKFHINK